MPDFHFDNPRTVTFEVDGEHRTIRGLALPFGDIGDNGWGKFSFTPGTLTWGKVKVLDGHDWSRAFGTAELSEASDGIHATIRVAPGPRGDEVLDLAAAGVYDGLSVGLDSDAQFDMRDGVNYATSGTIREISTTPIPAFANASITSVAASAAPNERKATVPENTPTETVATPAAPASTELDATAAAPVVPAREVVPAAPQSVVQLAVHESLPYRFDGQRGEHDFSTDLFDAIRFRDGAKINRLNTFVKNFAAISTGDVSDVNPSHYRPDLYVDQAVAATPVYDAIYKGGLTDSTPFVVPKFGSASGFVADHTEGVEPESGTFTATAQTVTPTAVSGLAQLTREVVDAGGNPQVSTLIWTQMTRAFAAAMEAKAAALLNGATAAALLTLTDETGTALGAAVEAALGSLVFVDGGEFFTEVVANQTLFTALQGIRDEDGRALYPQINPSNANGTQGTRFRSLNVGGWDVTPAKSIGTAGKKSYVFDPQFGGIWATGPQQITLPETVAIGSQVGIFGYVGTAVLDATKIRTIVNA